MIHISLKIAPKAPIIFYNGHPGKKTLKLKRGLEALTLACSLSESTTRRSTRDGFEGNRGMTILFALDTFLPGFWRASSASVCGNIQQYQPFMCWIILGNINVLAFSNIPPPPWNSNQLIGPWKWNFREVIFKLISIIGDWDISRQTALR